jgi:D-serine deaminase-like pyridoxal phosphate-dependent protein
MAIPSDPHMAHGAAPAGPPAAIGTPAERLETPAVTVDLAVLERNLGKMQAYCDAHRLAFRPHVKTHKIPAIARMQRAAGAQGIVCQKLSEAEVFADAGFDDVFIPYNLVGEAKTARLVRLARRIRVSAAVDSLPAAQGISAAAQAGGVTVPLLVECDTGGARAGVQSPQEAVELAGTLAHLPGVRFEGLMTFPTDPERTPRFLAAALGLLEQAGLEARVVSGGGTPQSWTAHRVPQLTEHRAGTYVYNDHNTLAAGTCTLDEVSLRVHATVVSRPTAARAILDSGSKTLSSDLHRDSARGQGRSYGLIEAYPDAVIAALSEEHAVVQLREGGKQPQIGERVTVVPNHCCVVSNLHDWIYGVRDGRVEQVWRVAARGTVQ